MNTQQSGQINLAQNLKHTLKHLNPNYRIAILVVAVVCLWMLTGLFGEGEPAEKSAPSAVKNVHVQIVEPQEHQRFITLIGRTEPNTIAHVAAETSGVVEKVLTRQGDKVRKGAPLAKLDMGTRQSQLKQAEAKLEEAEKLFETDNQLNKEGFRANTQLAIRKAELASARNALEEIKEDIANTTIRSPLGGVVEEELLDEGDYIQSGTAVFTIIGEDTSKLVGFASQQERRHIQLGGHATARLVTGEEITGTVSFVARNASAQTKTYTVEVLVPTGGDPLPGGMTAEIHIPTQPVTAHFVPHSSLVLNDAGDLGVMVAKNSTAHFVPVKMLSDTPEGAWIHGPQGTAHIVVRGQAYLVDGDAINTNHAAQGEQT